jgi:hypothetical protein
MSPVPDDEPGFIIAGICLVALIVILLIGLL